MVTASRVVAYNPAMRRNAKQFWSRRSMAAWLLAATGSTPDNSDLRDWLERGFRHVTERAVDFGFGLGQAVVIAIVARLLVIWLQRRIRRPRLIIRLGGNLTTLMANVVAIAIYIVAFALILAVFGVSLSALITYLSVTTLAIGLALQETLRNTIAGIYLLLERPFSIGDRVRVRDNTGRIENVEIRTTSIRSDSGDLVLVPNSIVFTEIVTNASTTRSVRLRLQIAKVPLPAPEAERQIRELIVSLPDLRHPDPLVQATAQTADGCIVQLSLWHAPETTPRATLIDLLQQRFPESDVTSAADFPTTA